MDAQEIGEKRKAGDSTDNNHQTKIKSSSGSSSSSKPSIKAPVDDDPDWDDDRPICELMVEYMKKKAARAKAKAKEEAERAEAAKAAKKSTPSGSGGGGIRASAVQRKDQQYYNETKKGMLVQRLLVRWWYAFDWPQPNDIKLDDVPTGYEELDGFPGVFVSMNVASLGKLLDLRKDNMKPSLKCMSKKSSAELQELCIRAYEAQIKALEEAEGEGAPLLYTLKKELNQVRKVNVEESDFEAKKFVF